MARGGANQLLAASEKLSDLMRGQGCPESQSRSKMRAESLGEVDGECENGNEDGKGCEVEAVAAGGSDVRFVGAGQWSGHVSENYEEQEVERDYY